MLDLQELSTVVSNERPAGHKTSEAVRALLRTLAAALSVHMEEEEKIFVLVADREIAYLGESKIRRFPGTAQQALQTFSSDHAAHLRALERNLPNRGIDRNAVWGHRTRSQTVQASEGTGAIPAQALVSRD